MATEADPQVNLGGDASDPEYFEVLLKAEEEAKEETAEGTEAAEEAGEDKTLKGEWQGSIIMEADILRLRRRRQILDGVLTRVPPEGEVEPHPEDGEYVVFYSHFDRGFGLPVSSYTMNMFRQFILQPHRVPPNAILAMSCMAACLEAYVGGRPTNRIWARYFQFARQHIPKLLQVAGQDSTVECGAAAVMPRKNSIFPRITGLRSCKKWQQTYFYVKNQPPKENEPKVDLINLPYPYKSGPPPKENNY